MKLKKYVALTAVLMVLSPITEFTTNANSQVVQASKNSHQEKAQQKFISTVCGHSIQVHKKLCISPFGKRLTK